MAAKCNLGVEVVELKLKGWWQRTFFVFVFGFFVLSIHCNPW